MGRGNRPHALCRGRCGWRAAHACTSCQLDTPLPSQSGAGCAATVRARGQLIDGEGGGWRQPGPEYSGACYFSVPISGGADLHHGLPIFASPDEWPGLQAGKGQRSSSKVAQGKMCT